MDLTPYVNSTIILHFISECDYGNSLYIDNINIRADNFVGISESIDFSEEILIAPNPASDLVFLKANFKKSKNISVEVVDISGKTLLQEEWQNASHGNDYQLDLSNVAEGIYLVRLKSENEIATKRLVIRK